MGIKNILFPRREAASASGKKEQAPVTVQTRDGQLLDLSRDEDRKRLRRIVVDLRRQTESLTRNDLADWRQAHQMALNVDNPSRQRLYQIYRDTVLDGHLTGCIEQRRGKVMARSFSLVRPDGEHDAEATALLDRQWFKDLMLHCLDAIYYGHSLIELGYPEKDTDGRMTYTGVTLIPRCHVVPEKHRITIEPGSDWNTGIDYRSPEYASYLIEAGRPDDLGLLLKCTRYTIPKKNVECFWDTFAEMFGMPMRIAHTSSRDDKERARIEQALENMGSSFWTLLGEGTDIEVKENSRGDSFNVYDQRLERCDKEISKIIIGQTMTIDDGSSLSQAQVHDRALDMLVEHDADMLRDIINDQLLPRMEAHGFPVKGLRFNWDYGRDYTPEQKLSYELGVADRYDVPGSYFEKEYGMPVGDRISGSMPPLSRGNGRENSPFFD